MDCEKYEPLLLDELYGELDEVTSAAVKRHVSGCARCASSLNGMKSTRRLAVLPTLELPEWLEDRILASVKEAQKVVPIQSRASRALSWAGTWAMRPQTAMAAVFLLMIGTSAFVIRSRQPSEHVDAVSVTEQGMPAGQSASSDGDRESLDSKAAAAAHGANQPAPITAPPVAAAPGGPVASAGGALAFGSDPRDPMAGSMDGITAGKGRVGANAKEDNSGLLGSALLAADDKNNEAQATRGSGEAEKKRAVAPSEITNAAAPAGAPVAPDRVAAADRADRDFAPRSQTISPPATKAAQEQQQQDGFSSGMAAYRSRNFAEATRQFDTAARTGDQNAALWAAKSVKDGNGGCTAALPRFDAVAQKAGGSGSWVGSEAQLEAARCQIATGQLDSARDRLSKLMSVPSHAAPAQQALNELNLVASRREAERAKASAGAGGGGGVARPAAPARAPARPAATAGKPAVDDANKANGF